MSDIWHRGLAWDEQFRKDAYKSKSVSIGVLLDVIRKVSAGHPI